ncbi:nucleotidyl transferase AbiEii/AbiGii toxin family protein [Burkholderia cepacia]|uniref:nucleotidyl transferase AbiEii/AbiGii toxin family protein n=1 Tax=Burkholderia cepacia TaxID=292 RepID=UPI002AB7BB31|nr:nucleotidyl transferase AbiEii/AbiGii toxin family protein [Burkholderia cepacia]
MFVQDLPRLSVDTDVVMRAHEPNRDEALAIINAELARAKTAIERQGYAVTVAGASGKNKGDDVKLLVSSSDAQVKVEVNYVFRGTLMPTVRRSVVPRAQELFRVDLEVPTLGDAELYGSKLVAALDRQHPRDIFDVQHMYDTLGMRADIVDAFVAYPAKLPEGTLPPAAGQRSPMVPSASRLIALMGLIVFSAFFVGVGFYVIWVLCNHQPLDDANKAWTFFAAGAAMFLPYGANKFADAFK